MTNIVQKVIIPISSLPPANSDGSYSIRYRVVSDGQNRTSHWSPVYNIPVYPDGIGDVAGAISIAGSIATIVWESVAGQPSYDVFTSYDNVTYTYRGTTNSTSYSLVVTELPPATLYVKIQVEGIVKQISPTLQIYSDSAIIS